MTIAIGELNHRVKIQSRASSLDSFGQQSTTWSDVVIVWAKIEPLSMREMFGAQAVQSEVTHKITVRYRSDFASPKVAAALRVLWGSRIFNLTAPINPDQRSRFLEIEASEAMNDG